tara:strand:- start:2995 stop:3441 length:447 start_codon:yes stop_codon:yes gene_type:complete
MDFILDMDGTLVDIQHRRHHVTNGSHNWKAFEDPDVVAKDTINESVAHVVKSLISTGNRCIVFSGRKEHLRAATEDQLQAAGIDPSYLILRDQKDNRPDHLIKKDFLSLARQRGFNPIFAIDDRPQVVRMWREEGLFTFDVNQTGEDF